LVTVYALKIVENTMISSILIWLIQQHNPARKQQEAPQENSDTIQLYLSKSGNSKIYKSAG